jgi:hypothetical protein
MVDTVAKFLKLPMQTGPGIDIPETPGHEHPHPSAEAADREAPPTSATAARTGGTAGRSGGPGAASRQVVINEADAARAQKLGFRRWRG